MKESLKLSLQILINSKKYMCSIIITSFLCFAYFVQHIGIGIDDLTIERYIGENYFLYQGRFITWLLDYITTFGGKAYSNFFSEMIGIMVYVIYIVVVSGIIFFLDGRKNECIKINMVIVFSCLSISYPLICEGMFCGGLMREWAVGALCAAIAWWLSYSQKDKGILFSSVLIMMSCACYESAITVYVSLIFIYYVIRMESGESLELKKVGKDLVRYSVPCILGVILAKGISWAIIMTLPVNEAASAAAANTLFGGWRRENALKQVIMECLTNFAMDGLWYYPILVLLIVMLLFSVWGIVSVKKTKSALLCLSYIGLIASLFIMTVLMGKGAPYRVCTNFSMVVGFGFCMLYLKTIGKHKIIQVIVGTFLVYIFINQINILNYKYELDWRRAECEANEIKKVGNYLEQSEIEKPVVFVGEYDLPYDITRRIIMPENVHKSLEDTLEKVCRKKITIERGNIVSSITWGIRAFGEVNTELLKLFSYYGYDIQQGTEEMFQEASVIEPSMESWPNKNCLRDMGNYYVFKW